MTTTASISAASTLSTAPTPGSSTIVSTVSPFLAALLAGTAPPPLASRPIAPPPITTTTLGATFSDARAGPWPFAPSPVQTGLGAAAGPGAGPFAPSPVLAGLASRASAAPTWSPASPAPAFAGHAPPPSAANASLSAATASRVDDYQSPMVPYAAPSPQYGAGLYGQPLFYSVPPLAYGAHSPPPAQYVPPPPPPAAPAPAAPAPDVAPTLSAAPVHFAHLLTVKLNADNYLLWRAQVLPLLRSHYLEGFVDGTLPCPPSVLQVTTADGTPMMISNPAHRQWVAQDQAILGAIQSSLTPSVAGMVVFAASSRDAWGTLDSSFSSQSMARSMAIRTKLGEIKKLDSSVTTYFNKVKEMADVLSSIGQPLRDEEFQSFILNGLDEEYEALVENINGRDTPLPSRDLYARLLNTEQRHLKLRPEGLSTDASAHAAYRGGGCPPQPSRQSPGGGQPPRSPTPPSTPPRPNNTTAGRGRAWCCTSCGAKAPCQLCGIEGHLASRCHRRFKHDFLGIGNDGRGNEKQAALATQGSTSSYPVDPTWYMDTGATDHLTHELSKLNPRDTYTGHDQVRTADGSGIGRGARLELLDSSDAPCAEAADHVDPARHMAHAAPSSIAPRAPVVAPLDARPSSHASPAAGPSLPTSPGVGATPPMSPAPTGGLSPDGETSPSPSTPGGPSPTPSPAPEAPPAVTPPASPSPATSPASASPTSSSDEPSAPPPVTAPVASRPHTRSKSGVYRPKERTDG
ncbi:hypothetical protein QYE76_021948 [Lolium multiflorum]|uniref:Retrotransposon Copia-like N-terminal domain-containing protein n=1 Tax=Lolium multiflorum TaxID=4521 RepID=A0AAD8VSP5_LOLMU|nr:hypothetical protein QYE76_021948 [Lolium multiflorum]